MPLDTQDAVIPIQLAVGLATGGEPRLEQRGLLRLENLVANRRGALGKRSGTTLLNSGATEPHMATLNGKPALIGTSLSVYNATTSAWDNIGATPLFDLALEHKQQIGAAPTEVDYCESGDIACVIAGGARTYSRTTGKFLFYDAIGLANRVILANGIMWIVSLSADMRYLEIRTVNLTTGAISAPTQSALPVAPLEPYCFDACYVGGAKHCFLACYVDSAKRVQFCFYDDDGFAWDAGIASGFPSGYSPSVGCFQLTAGTAILVYGYYTGGVYKLLAAGYGAAHTLTISAVDLAANEGPSGPGATGPGAITGAALTSTTARIFWGVTAFGSPYNTHDLEGHSRGIQGVEYVNASGTGTVTATRVGCLAGASIVGRAFLDALHRCYLVVSQDAPMSVVDRPGYVVVADAGSSVDLGPSENMLPVAGVLAGYGYYSPTLRPGTVFDRGGDVWVVPLVEYGRSVAASEDPTAANFVCSTALATLTKGLAGCQALEADGRLLIPGALPLETGGSQVFEQGYLSYPYLLTAVKAAGAGLTAGTYGYAALLEWFDCEGRRHVSAPSFFVSVAVSAGDLQVTVTTCGLTITRKLSPYLVLYRTLSNGATYYRLTTLAWGTNSYTDATQDATLEGEEQLYTGGDALANVSAPPYRVSCLHANRIFAVPIEDERRSIWYSKPLRPTVGLEWGGEVLSHQLDAGGPLTGLASFFARLFAFSTSRSFTLNGAPKDNAGGGAGFDSYTLSDGVGCNAQRSIIATPSGLMFGSPTGVKRISQALQLEDAGEAVKYHTDSLTIARAVHQPARSSALFVTDGLALEFNYRYGIWSTRTVHVATDACIAGGLLYFRTSAGKILKEATATYSDETVSTPILLETGWLSFADLAGFMRVRKLLVLGYNISSHTLSVQFQFNGDPTWGTAQTFATSTGLGKYFGSSAFLGAGLDSTYTEKALVLDAVPEMQRNLTSIRVRISDSGAGASAGVELVGLAFVVAVKKGAHRIDPARQMA